jgi:hypothetical protein
MACMQLLRRIAVVALALSLGGCLTSTGVAILGADTAAQLATGRSIQGNVMYALTGKECAPVNALVGKPMCREVEAAQPELAPRYCYRTLGQVTCHSEPDPWMSGESRLSPELVAQPNATAKPPVLAER